MVANTFTSRAAHAQMVVIERYLDDEGGADPGTLAALLGIQPLSVRTYLRHMRAEGRVHRLPDRDFWMAGPDQEWLDQLLVNAPDDINRSWVSCQQTGQARREPLVAALFGPAPRKAGAGIAP